jgi:hypothetical protein
MRRIRTLDGEVEEPKVPDGFHERLVKFLNKELDPAGLHWVIINKPNEVTIYLDDEKISTS